MVFILNLNHIFIIIQLMSNQRLTIVRLQKQQRSIQAEPIPHLIVKRKGLLDFHFCIYGLQGAYQGGFYHGVLKLPADYPFSPPQLKFYTQSGRFQTNKPICTTFTNFHKEQWTSAWNVRSMLVGLTSFMTGSDGGYGSINESESKKRVLASKSLSRNMQNAQFVELFKQSLQKLNLFANYQKQKQDSSTKISEVNSKHVQNSSAVYFLIGLLVLVFILYGMFRGSINKFLNENQETF